MTHPNLDDILDLLSYGYRRDTIRVLLKTPEGTVRLEELIDTLLQETGSNSEQRDQIGVHLHHNHLPKLREQGLIEYDPNARLVQYRPNKQVEAVMDGIAVGAVEGRWLYDTKANS